MNVSVMHNNLVCAAKLVSIVTPKKARLPILSTTRLIARSSHLTLYATNLEFGLIAHMGARVEVEGDWCVDLRGMYTAAVKSDYRLDLALESTPVRDNAGKLLYESLALTVMHSSDHQRESLAVVPGKNYPVPCYIPFTLGKVEAKHLKRGLEFVQGVENSHDPLVYLAASADALTLTAYDGKRIHEATIPADFIEDLKPRAISIDSAKKLIRVFSKGKLSIAQDESGLYFSGEVAPLASPVEVRIATADKLPADFSNITHTDYSYSFDCRADALRSAIKQGKVFSKYVALATERYICEIDGAPNCDSAVFIRAESEELGDISTGIASATPLALPNRTILMWVDQALDVLDTAAKVSEMITVRINKPSDPIFIETQTDGIALSAAIAAMKDPRAHTAYRHVVTEEEEARTQWQERETAEREYGDWIRDQFGLAAYTRTSHSLYRVRGLLHYSDVYDVEVTYSYFYADGPVPGFQVRQAA